MYPNEMMKDLLSQPHLARLAPSARDTLLALVDTVFFASLALEEGEPVRVAVVHDKGGAVALAELQDSRPNIWGIEKPPLAWQVTRIRPRPFTPTELAKFSRGVRYGDRVVVVGGDAPNLKIEGIARRNPISDGGDVTRLAAPRPGVLVFEEKERELLRFEAGTRIDPHPDVIRVDGLARDMIGAILGDIGKGERLTSEEWVLESLVRRTRAVGHGAILAMSPSPPPNSLPNLKYALVRTDRLSSAITREWELTKELATREEMESAEDLSADEISSTQELRSRRFDAREQLEAAIEEIAELSAIDGAVLIGPRLAVYGAGHMISGSVKEPVRRAFDVMAKKTEPLPNTYGARHTAAIAFAQDNTGGVAFVVSEDGPVSCIARVNSVLTLWRVRISET